MIRLCNPSNCCWRAVFYPFNEVICCWIRLFSAFWKLKCLFLSLMIHTFLPKYELTHWINSSLHRQSSSLKQTIRYPFSFEGSELLFYGCLAHWIYFWFVACLWNIYLESLQFSFEGCRVRTKTIASIVHKNKKYYNTSHSLYLI